MTNIFFNEPKVLDHLLTYGLVYTVRNSRRIGLARAITGNYFDQKFWTKVSVEFVTMLDGINSLTDYTKDSGFDSLSDWIKSITKRCKNFQNLNLYLVKKID